MRRGMGGNVYSHVIFELCRMSGDGGVHFPSCIS